MLDANASETLADVKAETLDTDAREKRAGKKRELVRFASSVSSGSADLAGFLDERLRRAHLSKYNAKPRDNPPKASPRPSFTCS